jgi:hypothetical protein
MKKYWLMGLLTSSMLLVAAVAGCSSAAAATTIPASPTASTFLFTTQPGGAVAGAALTAQPVVWVTDSNDNIAYSYNGPVTIASTSGTGASGATLSGTTTVTAVAGVAEFTDPAIDTAGSGYTLTVSADNLASVTSASFDVSAPAAPAS